MQSDDAQLDVILRRLREGDEAGVRALLEATGMDAMLREQQMASMYLRLGRFDVAEACLRDAMQRWPASAVLLNDLGVVLYQAERYLAARDAVLGALALDPRNAAAIENLGAITRRLAQAESAIAAMEAARSLGDWPRAAACARQVLAQVPDHPEARCLQAITLLPPPRPPALADLLERFRESYARLDFGRAVDAAQQALDAYPLGAYRYFVGHDGSKWLRALVATGRLDACVEYLDEAFKRVPDLNLAVEDDPQAAETARRTRAQRIEQGLPSALLITQKKSGSVTLGSVFSEGFALPCYTYSLIFGRVIPSWAADYARGGASYVTHLMPDAVNIAALKRAGLTRVIVHVRDPRQALLSWAHHVLAYRGDFPDWMAKGYPDWPLEAKVDSVFEEYYAAISWIEGWLDAAGELDILFSTFESFKQSPHAVIERYLAHYGGDLRYFRADRVFVENEGTDYHRRKGEVDEWRQVMTGRQIERMNRALPPRLQDRFGWTL